MRRFERLRDRSGVAAPTLGRFDSRAAPYLWGSNYGVTPADRVPRVWPDRSCGKGRTTTRARGETCEKTSDRRCSRRVGRVLRGRRGSGIDTGRRRPPDQRLSPAPAAAGYISAYTLATGIAVHRSDASTECASRAAARTSRPSRRPAQHERAGRQLERLLRRLPTDGSRRRAPVGPIWLGYYRSRERRRELPRARSCRAIRATPRRTRRSPTSERPRGRPGDRLGRPRPRVHGLRVLGRPGRHARRPSATSGSRATTTRAAPTAPPINDGKRFVGTTVVDQGLVGAEPARQVQRQDGDRGRPDRRRPATATSTSRGRASPATAANNIYFSRSTDHGATWSQPDEA